jgi:hypothetical protein
MPINLHNLVKLLVSLTLLTAEAFLLGGAVTDNRSETLTGDLLSSLAEREFVR